MGTPSFHGGRAATARCGRWVGRRSSCHGTAEPTPDREGTPLQCQTCYSCCSVPYWNWNWEFKWPTIQSHSQCNVRRKTETEKAPLQCQNCCCAFSCWALCALFWPNLQPGPNTLCASQKILPCCASKQTTCRLPSTPPQSRSYLAIFWDFHMCQPEDKTLGTGILVKIKVFTRQPYT